MLSMYMVFVRTREDVCTNVLGDVRLDVFVDVEEKVIVEVALQLPCFRVVTQVVRPSCQ